MSYHVPVLLKESIQGLSIDPDGIYIDVTFGGGGHSKEILTHIKKGKLFSFDQDQDAAQQAKQIQHTGFTFIKSNFVQMKEQMGKYSIKQVDGILADLGVSSHQFDTPARGFSTRWEGKLDMRMNQEQSLTAEIILNEYSESQLHYIFGVYGEVKNAKTLAADIVSRRVNSPFYLIDDLKNVLDKYSKIYNRFKYYAQVFQALRIEVNNEMQALKDFLTQLPDLVKEGGRISIISYHSLEDRLVKNFINKGNLKGKLEIDIYGNHLKPFKAINTKPIIPTEEEIQKNNRARSAKLRIAERV